MNNIKSLCEKKFRSSSSKKLKINKNKLKCNNSHHQPHNSKPIYLSNTNQNFFNNSNNNFYSNSPNNINNNNINSNFDSLTNIRDNLANNNVLSHDTFNTFQHKRMIKNHISSSFNNAIGGAKSSRISATSMNFNNVNVNVNLPQTNNFISNNSNSNLGRNTKSDLKHLLVFSDSSNNNNNYFEKNSEINNNSNNNINHSSNQNFNNNPSKNWEISNKNINFNINIADKTDKISYRVNSESSLANYFNIKDSNKFFIFEIMKNLKYQFCSIDHQKNSLEKLIKSKAKYFSILINEDCSKKKVNIINIFILLPQIYIINFL